MVAKIAVSAANFAIDKPYSYQIPHGMDLQPGQRVVVPFGRGNRRAEGVVLAVDPADGSGLKAVEQIIDEEPLLSAHMLRLAAFLRERYFCTFYDAVRVMLPAGASIRVRDSYRLTEDRSWQEKPGRQPDAMKILHFIADMGGETTGSAIAALIPEEEPRLKALKYLLSKKWVESETDITLLRREKTEKIVSLAVPAEDVREYLQSPKLRSQSKRKVLELLCSLEQASVKDVCYFTGVGSECIRSLVQAGYLAQSEREVLRCSEIRPAKLEGPLVLNEEQQAAFEGLSDQMNADTPGIALLYGVTGSGKTSVYLQLIRRCVDAGRAAMLLVPEIALTPQLLSLLAAHFGQNVAVLHSSLSAGERYDQWKRVRSGDARVIVGTRSAVFAPSSQLGLIIVDEEQEHSYRSDQSPRYSAKEVAIWRGYKEKALVLLGSATPSVETMYHAKQGDYKLYTLKNRYNGKALPQVQIVDLKEEVKMGNDRSFSYELLDAMNETRKRGKQTILFLNRRGNARALQCVECGEAPECPRCSTRLTYHSANSRLMCHYCGYSQPTPKRCPTCGGPLKTVGTGTQKLQQELLELCPEVEVVRMDSDTVSATNTHEQILDHFREQNIPVLIGTQMVAKGLNLPDVTLVGVLDADMSLYAGTFRAAENTFQMLTQVVGRAGRGDTPGRAVIQTMVPEHQVLLLAARQDYDGFYDLELQMRRIQNLPPFGDVASVTFVGPDESRVLRGGVKFRDSLLACLKQPPYTGEQCTVLGPAPCAVMKINYNFRYRLTLRCHMTRQLRQLIAHLLCQFGKDGANRGVSAFADVNGFDE